MAEDSDRVTAEDVGEEADSLIDSVTDAASDKRDEITRVLRALVHASAEAVNVMARTVSDATSEVQRRNEAGEDDSVIDMVRQFPSDLNRGVQKGFDTFRDNVSRPVDRFHEVYEDTRSKSNA